MPQLVLDRELADAIRLITDRFISTREGTPAHLIKTQLGKKRHLIEQAVRNKYLRDTGLRYFPCFRALDLEDSDSRRSVEQCTTLVFKALRAIYERDGDRMCDQVAISEMCKKIEPSSSSEAVRVGMLFATDFSIYIHLWNASPDSDNFNLNLATSERLLDFEDLPSAWQKELRNRAHASAGPVTDHTGVAVNGTTALVFETTGETYTAEGIEGEGGAARVFRVTDSDGNRWALKCLRSDQATSTRTKRFLNELDFCRHSVHSNIVRVTDQGFVIQGGRKCPFYVMPLYPSTLWKLLCSGIPVDKRMHYFLEILNGVEAAHLRGVWHRDLKPKNVLHDLTTDTLLVSDFGIAHFTTDEMYTTVDTTPSDRLANFQYAAPEQRREGEPVDHRADIYPLGLILNEMFTGHVLQGAGYKRISEICPQFAYLDELVEKMVQQSPENRPGSIDEIKLILDANEHAFISRQKLDQLRDAVVPSTAAIDPFLQNPVSVIRFDVRGDTFVAQLKDEPRPDWIRVFTQQPVRGFVAGAEPANWRFSSREAILSFHPQRLEPESPLIANYFRNYVQEANALYRQKLDSLAQQREESERLAYREQIAAEERRQRILAKLNRPKT